MLRTSVPWGLLSADTVTVSPRPGPGPTTTHPFENLEYEREKPASQFSRICVIFTTLNNLVKPIHTVKAKERCYSFSVSTPKCIPSKTRTAATSKLQMNPIKGCVPVIPILNVNQLFIMFCYSSLNCNATSLTSEIHFCQVYITEHPE